MGMIQRMGLEEQGVHSWPFAAAPASMERGICCIHKEEGVTGVLSD